jgi:dATP pyrophosphohydrolase
MTTSTRPWKIPESVLVVIHTPALDVLLIRRADANEFWQSVTGSKDAIDEPLALTAAREVAEEPASNAARALRCRRNWSTGS